MIIVLVVFVVFSVLLLLSTLICGLWIRAQGISVDKSSLNFHMLIGIGSILVTVFTLVLGAVRILNAAG